LALHGSLIRCDPVKTRPDLLLDFEPPTSFIYGTVSESSRMPTTRTEIRKDSTLSQLRVKITKPRYSMPSTYNEDTASVKRLLNTGRDVNESLRSDDQHCAGPHLSREIAYFNEEHSEKPGPLPGKD
jgi:hypothetical protein